MPLDRDALEIIAKIEELEIPLAPDDDGAATYFRIEGDDAIYFFEIHAVFAAAAGIFQSGFMSFRITHDANPEREHVAVPATDFIATTTGPGGAGLAHHVWWKDLMFVGQSTGQGRLRFYDNAGNDAQIVTVKYARLAKCDLITHFKETYIRKLI